MSEPVTLADVVKYWNPTQNRPSDHTRFPEIMRRAYYQEQNREQERPARDPEPRMPTRDALHTPPVRRPGRKRIQSQPLEATE